MANIRFSFFVIILLGLSEYQTVFGDNVTTALIAQMLGGSEDENIVFSPFLVTESLMQLYLGAGGETLKQIEIYLQLEGLSKDRAVGQFSKRQKKLQRVKHLTLNRGSRIYVARDVPIMSKYQKESSDIFNTTVEKVDFRNSAKTVSQMNSWTAKLTNYKLNTVFTEIENEAKIMTLSAFYFEGKWKFPFNPLDTRKASFFMPEKTGGFHTALVDTMKRKGRYKYSYIYKLNAYAIEIPYAELDISMIILLPKDMDGVEGLVQKLGSVHLHEAAPRMEMTNLRILLPKFKIGSMLTLRAALESLGIHDLFKNANLEAMIGPKTGFSVNEIVQQTEFEMDENASKSVNIKKVDFGFISRQFVAEVNHPFVFLVTDRKSVFIAGRVNTLK
ncbi:hypothetical protein ACLKA7_015105 [Drosophila subpalustris]